MYDLKTVFSLQPRSGRKKQHWLQWALALAGLGLFIHLVATSGITGNMLWALGWRGFGLLFMVSLLVIVLDTVGWFYAVRHIAQPKKVPLLGLRIAGDSLTNALPGGVVLGEAYKAMMMRQWFGISLADNAASLMIVKFGLGFSQALFVLLGLGVCYPLLETRSLELFGFRSAQYVALVLTLAMGLLMFLAMMLLLRGRSFTSLGHGLAKLPLPPLRRWLARHQDKLASLDVSCASVFVRNRKHLFYTFFYLELGWLLSSLESYILLYYLGAAPKLAMAYVIESVGSLFRLIFFLVPSGIGGQDASFMALFKLYHLPTATAGAFVLIKRFKEVLWIGIGFVLIVLFRRKTANGSVSAAAAVTEP
jgi:hypothetical protein